MKKEDSVIDWLLGEDQPSVRYLALRDLLGRPKKDPEVKSAMKNITKTGWAKDLFEKQLPGGYWFHEKNIFMPRFLATFWMLLILSDLGLTKSEPRIAQASELWLKHNATKDGGFSQSGKASAHLCITGNSARALVKLGYEDHPKVRKAFEWFVRNQAKLGGWSCWNFGKPPLHGKEFGFLGAAECLRSLSSTKVD